MLALLRLVVFEWILARLALRWVLGIGILAVGGVIFLVGIPTLLVLGAIGYFGWRVMRRRPEDAAASETV